jgi:hypothetical protein
MTLLRVAWARYGMRAALVALLKIMVAVVQWRSRHGPAEARGVNPPRRVAMRTAMCAPVP